MTHLDDRPPVEEPPWDDPGEPSLPRDTSTSRGGDVPQDIAAEQLVLGAAMIGPTALEACSKIVTGADFWRPSHETIWRHLNALRADEKPTTSVALVAALLDAGELQHVGGASYIHTLEHSAIDVADATFYATRVDSLARRRRAIERLEHGLFRLRRPGPDHDIDEVLNTTTAHLLEAREELANPPAATTWSPVALDAVLAGEYLDPPPTMLARSDGVRLFYAGAVHSVSGESESGKTWLCLLAVLQELQADNDAVFVDFEDRADRVVGRLLALGATPDQIREHFSYIRPDRPLDDDGRAQLAPALAVATLVIVDGVTEAMTMHGYDLNSNEDSAKFQGLLPRWIADHGPGVALIDHVVKDEEKQGRFALGAQHKLAGLDGAAYIVKVVHPFARGKRGVARIDVGKDRPGHVREHTRGKVIGEFVLDATRSDVVLIAHFTPPPTLGNEGAATFEPTILMERISRAVQLTPGMSKKAVEGVVAGKTETKRLALELLVTRGYVLAKTESRGRIAHHHIKPYYQPDNDPDTTTDQADDDPSDGTLTGYSDTP